MPFDENKTRIANLALIVMGDRHTISDLDSDTSEAGEAIRLLYDTVLDELLSMHRWAFAQARATLVATTAPAFEWTYAYSLPSDYLSHGELYNPVVDGKFVIEGTTVLCEETTPYFKYTKRQDTPNKWHPLFAKLFYLTLAMRACLRIASMRDRFADLYADANATLAQAQKVNAVSQYKPESNRNKKENHSWTKTGR